MKQIEENTNSSSTTKKTSSDQKKKSEKKDSASKKQSKKKKTTTAKKEKIDSIKNTNDTTAINAISTDSTLTTDSLAQHINTTQVNSTSIAVPPPYMSGNEPTSRNSHPGHNSDIMILLSVTFILVAINFNSYRRMLKNYAQNLWNVRRRANAFDEHTTNERSLIFILILQLCVYTGLLISTQISNIIPIPPEKIIIATFSMIGLCGIYYILQLVCYKLIGYTFADDISSSQWIKGFKASQIFLGFALIGPTLGSIFYPSSSQAMLGIAISLYVIARLLFIFKGFRIFYNKIHSLFYFILYLCTLEIIPVIFLWNFSQEIIYNLL